MLKRSQAIRVYCPLLGILMFASAVPTALAAELIPPLTGSDAVAALKQSGRYNSLERAWREAGYGVERDGSSYGAQNQAQRFAITFRSDEAGLSLADSAAHDVVTLRLLGYGYGDRLVAPSPAKRWAAGRRVEYRRGNLTEWYENDQRGLEQGFTLAHPPVKGAAGPLVFALAVGGDLAPKIEAPGEALLIDSGGHAEMRYTDLRAWDSKRRPLAARLEVQNRQVRIIVDDRAAVYPITIDPLVSSIILQASDGVSADNMGTSLAVDGNIAVVGAPGNAGSKGEALVFVRSGSTWTQQTTLTASDGVREDRFGISVAVSGGTILVGASTQASGRGAAYVFLETGPNWSQQAELTATDGNAGDGFGTSVALNGTTGVVGAPGRANGKGTVYVYTGTGGVWNQQAEFVPNDAANGDAFGYSVALSVDTVIAGAYAKNNGQGAAYIFFRSPAGAWSQQAKLAASQLANDAQFGYSVAVNADTAIVGTKSKSFATGLAYIFVRTSGTWSQQAMLRSPGDSGADAFATAVAVNGDTVICNEPFNSQAFGEAYVFVRSGTTWTPQPKLTASDGAIGDVFSTAVALSADTALFGSPSRGNSKGEAYAFSRSGVSFVQQSILTAAGGSAADGFGTSIAVSGDTVMVGAPTKSLVQGAVYVFVRSGATWIQQSKLTPSDAANGDGFGASLATDGSTLLVGASGKNGQGVVYVFVQSGGAWTQQAELVAADPAKGDAFGNSVSLSANTAIVGAVGRLAAQGVAYVFVRSGTTWTQQAKLTASDAATNDNFGSSVSISGDTALVGARAAASFHGAAYVFVRSGSTWTQQAKLVPDRAGPDNFGYSVSIDADTALVGAYLEAGAQGAAYVFVRSGVAWTQQTKLAPSDAAGGDIFGTAVWLTGDTAVLGATLKNSSRGVTYAFVRSGSTWTQQLELSAPDAENGDRFGSAVGWSAGTLVATAGTKASGLGEAYVFPLPIITTGSIVDTISSQAVFAPGSLATLFGNHFSSVDTPNGDPPWQTTLNGVSLTVNGTLAAMSFAGYQQITFQIPYETATGPASIVVNANGASSAAVQVTVTDVSPGVVTTPDGRAMVQNDPNDPTNINSPDNPADDESLVLIYCAGLGLLDNPIPDGAAAPGDVVSNALIMPTVSIGGSDAPVTSATMLPGMVGIGQIIAQVPDLPAGDYPVVITQENLSSNGPVMSVSGNVTASARPSKAGVHPAAPTRRPKR
ncbi:MAG TPA: hypothetical protein VEV17_14020 [Bryobacteraceae bacterium]|nr:hypothetical protein [Bryobacteraceae bacterium]